MWQGVTCVGYTDLPSRLPTQSSTLYSNNLSKFLLSMGPFTGHKEQFYIDHKDDAVRGALVLDNGEMMWPAPPPKVGHHTKRRAATAAESRESSVLKSLYLLVIMMGAS